MNTRDKAAVNRLIAAYKKSGQTNLVALLQAVQERCGYLPKEALQAISRKLDTPLSRLFSIASFYNAFSLTPTGKNIIRVCVGTACHMKNSRELARSIGSQLGLEGDEGTTKDKAFTLTTVRCLGCCSLSPVVQINDRTYGNTDQAKMAGLIKKLRKDNS
jgi:NADH-quinone oxidoreductase subunit E